MLCELEAVALRLVVFEVVVRVAQLLHDRVAKHACVVKPVVRDFRMSGLHFRPTVPLLPGHALGCVVTLPWTENVGFAFSGVLSLFRNGRI